MPCVLQHIEISLESQIHHNHTALKCSALEHPTGVFQNCESENSTLHIIHDYYVFLTLSSLQYSSLIETRKETVLVVLLMSENIQNFMKS